MTHLHTKKLLEQLGELSETAMTLNKNSSPEPAHYAMEEGMRVLARYIMYYPDEMSQAIKLFNCWLTETRISLAMEVAIDKNVLVQ